jgi:hypothetical protein
MYCTPLCRKICFKSHTGLNIASPVAHHKRVFGFGRMKWSSMASYDVLTLLLLSGIVSIELASRQWTAGTLARAQAQDKMMHDHVRK